MCGLTICTSVYLLLVQGCILCLKMKREISHVTSFAIHSEKFSFFLHVQMFPFARKSKCGGSKISLIIGTTLSLHSSTLMQSFYFLYLFIQQETFSETQTEHLPSLLCRIITSLTRHPLSDTDMISTIQLCTKILSKVQPTMTTSVSHDVLADRSCDLGHDSVDQVEVLT